MRGKQGIMDSTDPARTMDVGHFDSDIAPPPAGSGQWVVTVDEKILGKTSESPIK